MTSNTTKGQLGESGGAAIAEMRRRLAGVGSRRQGGSRRFFPLRPWLEGLEDRTVLSTITWNTTAAATGGSWDTATNWTPAQVPGPSDTAVIKGLTGSGTVYLDSGNADSVGNLTTDSSTTLEVTSGSLSIGAASSPTLGGPVIVSSGASLNVGAGANLTIGANQTITVNGTLNFANGDAVGFGYSYGATTQIEVGNSGVINATGTKFATDSSSNLFTQIYVGTGGELRASGSTFTLSQLDLDNGSILTSTDLANDVFNLPLYAPYQDIALLGNNKSFDAINILGGSLGSGQSLNLALIGTTSTTNLSYDFFQGFSVQSGGSLTVEPDIDFVIGPNQTITDDGTINFGSGDAVNFAYSYGDSTELRVGSGGVIDATGTNFVAGSSSNNFTEIYVGTGGELTASGSTFTLSQLYLDNGSILASTDLANDVFNLPLYVPYQDIALLGNNKSFDAINILGGSLGSGQSLNLALIGTTSTTNLSYDFFQGFSVQSGGSLTVEPDVDFVIGPNQTITDDGTINFGSGDAVNFAYSYGDSTELRVGSGGVIDATGTNFVAGSSSNNFTEIYVGTGGELTASGSTFTLSQLYLDNGSILASTDLANDVFNLPLYAPYQDVALLANNQTFEAIDILVSPHP